MDYISEVIEMDSYYSWIKKNFLMRKINFYLENGKRFFENRYQFMLEREKIFFSNNIK